MKPLDELTSLPDLLTEPVDIVHHCRKSLHVMASILADMLADADVDDLDLEDSDDTRTAIAHLLEVERSLKQ
jgi:hypothetical protein